MPAAETDIERKARETYIRRKVEQVMADAEFTQRVVIAAVQAHQLLTGQYVMPDGDTPERIARETLGTALTDFSALSAALSSELPSHDLLNAGAALAEATEALIMRGPASGHPLRDQDRAAAAAVASWQAASARQGGQQG